MTNYTRNPFVKIKFDSGKIMVYGGRHNKRIVGSKLILDILKYAEKPESQSCILDRLEKNYAVDSAKGRELLKKLHKSGFLESDVVTYVKDTEFEGRGERIKSFNIPTYMRPDALELCVSSYVRNFEEFGHRVDVNIFDDSSGDAAMLNREVLGRIAYEKDLHINYIGRQEKAKFVEALIQRLPDLKQEIEFAFVPEKVQAESGLFKSGANRNFIMAYNAGELFLTADDDSLCHTYEDTGEELHKLYFAEGRAGIQKAFSYGDSDELRTTVLEQDVIEIHERVLGSELKSILRNHNLAEININMMLGSSEIFPNNYHIYENSKVHFTFHPITGWPDQTADEALYDFIDREDIRLLSGETNVMVHETIPGQIIYSKPFLLTTTLTGFDNRVSKFPFFPVHRNEDVHYSYMLNCLEPFALSCAVNPPLEHRKLSSGNQMEAFQKNFFGDIVLTCILYNLLEYMKLQVSNDYVSFDSRRNLVSKYLHNVCGKNQVDFLKNLENLKVDLHKVWAEKNKLAVDISEKMKLENDPVELKPELMDYEVFINSPVWSYMRDTLKNYANLLVSWEAIMNAAKDVLRHQESAVRIRCNEGRRLA